MPANLMAKKLSFNLNYWLIVGLGPGGLGFNRGTPKNPNPFHRGIPEIQTTGPQTNN